MTKTNFNFSFLNEKISEIMPVNDDACIINTSNYKDFDTFTKVSIPNKIDRVFIDWKIFYTDNKITFFGSLYVDDHSSCVNCHMAQIDSDGNYPDEDDRCENCHQNPENQFGAKYKIMLHKDGFCEYIERYKDGVNSL